MGGFQGTLVFASINTLQEFNGFRRDDLESLGYSIMLLIDRQKVPWLYLEDKKSVLEKKIEFSTGNCDPVFMGI
jgi:hypothetical protein